MQPATTSPTGRFTFAASRFGEIVFLFDLFAVFLIGGGLLLGLNPFISLVPALVVLASPLVLLWHHFWFERNRDDILVERGRHLDRERRGF